MFRKLKLVHLFTGTITAFWLAFTVLAAVGIWAESQSTKSLHQVHDVRMRRTALLDTMARSVMANRAEVLLMFQHDPQGALRGAHDHELKGHFDRYAERREVTNRAWKELEDGVKNDEETRLIAAMSEARKAWLPKANAALDAVRREDFSQAIMAEYLRAGRNEGEALSQALDAASQYQQDQAALAARESSVLEQRIQWIFGALAVLLGVPGTIAGIYILRRLSRGLNEAGQTASAIASGDLNRPIPLDGHDEIAELQSRMHTMQQHLVGVIGQVRQAADAIEVAATEVASGNADLSQRTELTAANLQQTASSAEQLGTTVAQTAENARQANGLAESASGVAHRGGEVVQQVVGTMREIETSSRKIADIIGVIDGIAFQTNILALNAAVEAARAGESGRGFAVVATEVRNLAQRSADAAREIKSLIGASVDKVEVGARQADEAGQTMSEVVHSIQSVASVVGEISHASEEQAQGVAMMSSAVGEMDQATQQNAALVEQSAAAAASLREQAHQLVKAVASFKL